MQLKWIKVHPDARVPNFRDGKNYFDIYAVDMFRLQKEDKYIIANTGLILENFDEVEILIRPIPDLVMKYGVQVCDTFLIIGDESKELHVGIRICNYPSYEFMKGDPIVRGSCFSVSHFEMLDVTPDGSDFSKGEVTVPILQRNQVDGKSKE